MLAFNRLKTISANRYLSKVGTSGPSYGLYTMIASSYMHTDGDHTLEYVACTPCEATLGIVLAVCMSQA